jgi:hypothetical protein
MGIGIRVIWQVKTVHFAVDHPDTTPTVRSGSVAALVLIGKPDVRARPLRNQRKSPGELLG